MSLADGDYISVEDKIVETLMGDTGSGGLRESGAPAVATIEAGDISLMASFGQADFPAILVRTIEKSESPPGPAYNTIKTFAVKAAVLDRAMDRGAVEESVRKVSARLEQVLREQTATDKQFLGLPDLIDGAEGVLVCSIRETRFIETDADTDQVIGRADVITEIMVPCAFRYE